jgi:Icc-related predicted phosphoesterase
MKVLAAADVHGLRPVYDWLIGVARDRAVDALVLAGDLLGSPDEIEPIEEAQRHDARGLVPLLESAGLPVLYVMGNDDLIELDPRSERFHSLHGRRIDVGGFNFVGYQYTLPFMGGTFEKPEDGIAADLEPLSGMLDARTIVVSHGPAAGILDPGVGGVRIGSQSLRAFLAAHPFRAHIHGHSHSGFGRDDRHFNVACGGRMRAMILDLESLQHEVLGAAPPRPGV